MTLQNIFYLVAIITFLMFAGLVIYLYILATRLNRVIKVISEKAKNTAETFALAKYSIKAGILKTILNIVGKGGEKYD